MPDSSDNGKIGSTSSAAGKGTEGGIGIKFNQVGREEPAQEVLTPQIDPALRRRRFFFILLATVALAALIVVSLIRFGLTQAPTGEVKGERLRPPEQRFE